MTAAQDVVTDCWSGVAWDSSDLWQAVSQVCNTTLMQCVRDKLSGDPLPMPRGMSPVQRLHNWSAKLATSEEHEAEEEGKEGNVSEAALPPSPACGNPGCACSGSEQRFWSAVGECRRLQEKGLRDLGPVCGSAAYFVYAGLLSILPRYPTAAGFLWTNDDLILNYWNLEHRNKVLYRTLPFAGSTSIAHRASTSPVLSLTRSVVSWCYRRAQLMFPLLFRNKSNTLVSVLELLGGRGAAHSSSTS